MRKVLPKAKIKALVVLAFSSFLLTACTLGDLPVIGKFFKKTSEPVTLTMWGLWEPKEVIDSVITKYQATHPNVTIQYEERSFASVKSYKDSITTRLAEGTAPDIILVHNSWVPALSANLEPAPDAVLSSSDYQTLFYPSAVESSVFDSKVYAVPLSYDGLALVYNRDMFDASGISTPPSTWEEFRVVASQLTKREGDTITQAGAAVGTASNVEHFSDILGLLFSQGGVKFPDDLGNQASADAVSFYTNFVTQEKVWSNLLPPSIEAFADGKVAMIFVPSWEVLSILNRNPQINMAVAPVPKPLDLEGSPINVEWGSFWMEAVSKNGSNKDVAWDFLKFMTGEEGARALFDEQSKLRAFGQPYALRSLKDSLAGNPYLDVYLKSAETAKSGLLSGKAGNDKETDALAEAINKILLGTPAAEALSTVKDSLK